MKTPPNEQAPREGELILYRAANDAVKVEVLYESDTFWLDQKRIAELFGVDVRTISEHLRNIYDSGELSEEATLRKIRMVRTEGNREVTREVSYYNLDSIISVGYRVNSTQATQFRIWATQGNEAHRDETPGAPEKGGAVTPILEWRRQLPAGWKVAPLRALAN